jgi:hypothetical protein
MQIYRMMNDRQQTTTVLEFATKFFTANVVMIYLRTFNVLYYYRMYTARVSSTEKLGFQHSPTFVYII